MADFDGAVPPSDSPYGRILSDRRVNDAAESIVHGLLPDGYMEIERGSAYRYQ